MKNEQRTYKNYEKALEQQKRRYIKRLDAMMQKDLYRCYFLTFTFTDKQLAETSQETRERYIKEYLNQQAEEYMLNCDYGKLKGREHYHAVILSRYKVILTDAEERHGFYIKAKKLHLTLSDGYKSKKLIDADYRYNITAENLTAHAFKETTRNSKVIYSRKAKKINRRFKRGADAKLKNYQKSEKGKANKKLFEEQRKAHKEIVKERLKLERDFDEYIGIA